MRHSRDTALMILAMLIWGASWVSGKVIAGMASPDSIVFLRFAVSFIAFIPFLPFILSDLKASPRVLASTALCGAILVLYNQLFFIGLKLGTAASGGVIVTTLSPLFTFALASILFRKSMTKTALAGLVLGLASGVLLVAPWHLSRTSISSSGTVFFAVNAFVWAVLTVISQRVQKSISALGYSFYLYLFTALIQLPLCSRAGIISSFSLGPVFWLNILFLGIFAAGFASTVYFFASRRLGASRASSYMFIVPLSAVVFSTVILGEHPSAGTVSGGCLAIAAVWLINKKGK